MFLQHYVADALHIMKIFYLVGTAPTSNAI